MQETSFPLGLDVEWFPPAAVTIADPYLKNWLLDTGSLTERLQTQCRHFELKNIGQAATALHQCEQQWLKDSDETRWVVREVWLYGDGKPWVFARSILPGRLVDGELKNLGASPLGKRLFNDARFIRSEFELCRLTQGSAGHQLNTGQRASLWGRRSRFSFEGSAMIVAEVFMPDAPAYQLKDNHEI